MTKVLIISIMISITNTHQVQAIEWNIVLKNSKERIEVSTSSEKISRINNDIFCVSRSYETENEKASLYRDSKALIADCVYLKESFQLYSLCAEKNKQSYVIQSYETSKFDMYLECSL